MKKYVFTKYNKKFPELYRREKVRLKKILPKSVDMEHIGSTSISELGGKGIIDIIISTNKKDINKIKNKLQKKGYKFKIGAGDVNRLFFEKDYQYRGNIRRVHIHLTSKNSQVWKNSLGVRNHLNANKKDVNRYTKIKKRAIKICKGKGKDYRDYKKSFLDKLTKKVLKIKNA